AKAATNFLITFISHADRPEESFVAATFAWQPRRPASLLPMAFSFAPVHWSARAEATTRRTRTAPKAKRLTDMLKLIGAKDEEQSWPYCESTLMKHFGASLVHSFDNSGYEGATFIHDFNTPITNHETYDTVIDFGSLEHIYNVPQAFANVSALCAVGGQILLALPASNQCVRGFWEFAAELFYSLYSGGNGYKETCVFLANVVDETHWYEVKPPTHGGRAEVISPTPLVVLARTNKVGPLRQDVQQSD